jgi:hypothetical protein
MGYHPRAEWTTVTSPIPQVMLRLDVMSRQGRSPDLGYVDFRMTKH